MARGKVNKKHPEVIFLAEAFTRPAMMHALGRAGFQQSYTYFTWRNTKEELQEYFEEVSHESPAPAPGQFLRQHPGYPHRIPAVRRPGPFQDPYRAGLYRKPDLGRVRRLWLYEHVARPGAEEYIDNEKFSTRPATGTRRPNPDARWPRT